MSDHRETLDLLIERQIRAANDPDQGNPNYEHQAGWAVVPGWEPPPAPVDCQHCDGDGSDPEDGSTCPVCGGTGRAR
jgi:hypothetical protein